MQTIVVVVVVVFVMMMTEEEHSHFSCDFVRVLHGAFLDFVVLSLHVFYFSKYFLFLVSKDLIDLIDFGFVVAECLEKMQK